tara:strand:- start:1435 stop:1617 length:183 start_codon:yes stop_codon:yes gene_type:complete
MEDKIFGLLACAAWYFCGHYIGFKKGKIQTLASCESVIEEVIEDVKNGDVDRWIDKSEDS